MNTFLSLFLSFLSLAFLACVLPGRVFGPGVDKETGEKADKKEAVMTIQFKKPLLAMFKKPLLVGLPLAALLATSLGACAHGRLHHNLNAIHGDFYSQPQTRAEHRRLHEDLQALHEEERDRAYYGNRFSNRDPYYYGSGRDDGRFYWPF